MREDVATVIVGGGQSGLSMGYHLKRQGLPFVILDAHERIGDAWRTRWDSLRLFTPAKFSGLDGMRFPGPGNAKPTKDEMADYLEAYARRFELSVRSGSPVTRIAPFGDRWLVESPTGVIEADNVVVAVGAFGVPRAPSFAAQLDPEIAQIHSASYRNPSQLRAGGVLVVGVGNSGADIALDVARTHRTWLAGKERGHIPFDVDSFKARFLSYGVRFAGHHVLSLRTPIGRKLRPKLIGRAAPLVRVKPKQFAPAGVERVPRVVGVRDGLPLLEDGRTLDVANVIWCTGFRRDYSWVEAPVFDEDGYPRHHRGVVPDAPGLYFLGLEFQFALSSDTIVGVGRDARYLVRHIAARAGARARDEMRAADR